MLIYGFITIIISLCVLATSIHNENKLLRKQVYDMSYKSPFITKEYPMEVSDKDYKILLLTELSNSLLDKTKLQDSLITILKTKE